MRAGTDAKLYVIIPCFNEEKVLPVTSGLFLGEVMKMVHSGKISCDSRILFVDDGSRDQTWGVIQALAKEDRHFSGIRQSRNRGHQNALLAGLMEVKDTADITITIDCDGQDDIGAMEAMVDAWNAGSEIVYGVRSRRDTDTLFKRFSAEAFYRLIRLMGAEIVFNHADYRLISARALRELAKFGEANLFLRGMVPLVGFQSTSVYYERHERLAGETHYPLSRMLGLAFDGITSLSVRPLRMITGLGTGMSVLSFAGVVWAVVTELLGKTVTGWASTVCLMCFLGGIQLVCLGVLGEYIGKIYMEVKQRPRYIISERTVEGEGQDPENGAGAMQESAAAEQVRKGQAQETEDNGKEGSDEKKGYF